MSAGRVALPYVEPGVLRDSIFALLGVDGEKWLLESWAGEELYVRPAIIGTQPTLSLQVPREALLMIIVGYIPRVDAIPGGMKLQTSPENMVRSWEGGFGYAKVGANYGPSVLAAQDASQNGFHQILWLYGDKGECTEAGGLNIFMFWERRNGMRELVTAPLDDRLILDGVTRRSCLELARQRLSGKLEVTERKYTIGEVIEAKDEGRLLEAFAAGTAWFITPVSHIRHQEHDIIVPTGPNGGPDEITGMIEGWLSDIMYGRVEHEWAFVVPEERT